MSSRPTSIAVVAWIWICSGAMLLLGAVMAGVSFLVGSHIDVPDTTNFPPELALMNVLLGNIPVLVVLEFAIAGAAIWAGIEFLRLKRWARAVLEMLSWATLVWAVGFGTYWVYAWVALSEQSAPTGSAAAADPFQVAGAAFGVLTTAIFAVATAVMIWSLRSSKVRQAVSSAPS